MTDTLEIARQIPLPASTSTFELELEQPARVNESSLPPVDRGFRAWSFLSAAFFIEAIVWGFPNSFGVFLEAYLQDPSYTSQRNPNTILPLIGPLSSGIIYCSGPFINLFISRFPFYRRSIMWLGVACCWTSLFGASYTTRLQLLVFLQGVLYAVGGAMLYYPCISYMSEWFVRRRGLANGVIFAGTAAGGLVLPLILPLLISSQGPSRALRTLSIVIVWLLVLILPLMKGRLPELRSSRARVPARRRIWVFVPIVWLPTFATALKVDATNASIALALLNGVSVISRLSLGYLSDKFNPWSLALSTLLFTSVNIHSMGCAVIYIWGISRIWSGVWPAGWWME
ncbi:hypothetical protein WG66_013102 [Moniliophthora roreri]|nr:hypothetical protein WG66_013102 [Moniliophthora roreri]